MSVVAHGVKARAAFTMRALDGIHLVANTFQELSMQFSAASMAARARTGSAATVLALPWQLAAVVFAATSVIVGLIWDISWHMTIGRDTFWTPAHLAIYTGGAVAGLACGYEVLRRTFFDRAPSNDGVTVWRWFHGPLGGWLCIWGSVAMLTSAPFDNWWHDAYGLDVKIISPPHTLLALGFLAILAGALVFALAEQAREEAHESSPVESSGVAPWVVAYTSGLVLTMVSIFATEYTDRVLMHRALFYQVSALIFPFVLVAAARSTRLRFPATATAVVYTVVRLVQLWVLPLFEASPKLGPIRHAVDHMVPLDFPLLLIVPAMVLDLLMRRTAARGAWFRAGLLGTAFLAVFAALQWPFADFMSTAASRNALFRSDNFPYMMPSDSWQVLGKFWTEPAAETVRGFGYALVIAVLSARAGLGWGSWLRSVRR